MGEKDKYMTPRHMVAECRNLIREASASEASWLFKEGAIYLMYEKQMNLIQSICPTL